MGILLFFAFVSGFVTIFAPCIWPLLPIILSSTTTGGHKKPLGVTIGIMLSFGLLTLTISYVVKIIPFDPNILRLFAVFIIGFLGLTLVIPKLSGLLESYVSRLSGRLRIGTSTSSGFSAGFVTGLALGIVWTPCAGPILATIATLAATQSVNLNIVLVTFFYILGVGIPLFIFATAGRVLFTKSRTLTKYTGRVQQIFGIIMILTAILIATNYDKILQAKLLDFFPSYSNFVTKLENNSNVKTQLDILKGKSSMANTVEENSLFNVDYDAPDFTGITKWLNPEQNFSITDLKGKVVLVDFWTYTCINCIRTLPFVTSWYDKYHDKGFVVVGIHTPEFEFEKNTDNVLGAIDQYKIHYPVGQDNNYSTWNNYNNQYWPAEYLIDANGKIRRTHFGEGEYDETEKAIQILLKEKGENVTTDLEKMKDETPHGSQSPETYIGSNRMQYYYPDGNLSAGKKTFTKTSDPVENSFSLFGEWNILGEYSLTGKNAALVYNFNAQKVFLVMSPGVNKSAQVKVFIDGELANDKNSGIDVKNGVVTVDRDRLYNLIDLHGKNENHILKLEFENSETEVFAFTFG